MYPKIFLIQFSVKDVIAGIKAGRDELYEKAVELILNQSRLSDLFFTKRSLDFYTIRLN